ncbi:MAG: hypothetical protein Kow0070_09720 [Anaerolineales bacterium]
MPPFLSLVVLLLTAATSVGILLAHHWRWLVIFLAAQYVGIFVLALQHLPLGMATVKVIAGWMGAAVLAMTRSNFEEEEDASESLLPQGRLFRLIAAAIVNLVAFAAAPQVDAAMGGAGSTVSSGSLLLIGMGLLHLGITDQPMRVTAGLMTVMAGFEVLYAAVENSVLVAALLATINLGLALTGAYLMTAARAVDETAAEEEAEAA